MHGQNNCVFHPNGPDAVVHAEDLDHGYRGTQGVYSWPNPVPNLSFVRLPACPTVRDGRRSFSMSEDAPGSYVLVSLREAQHYTWWLRDSVR